MAMVLLFLLLMFAEVIIFSEGSVDNIVRNLQSLEYRTRRESSEYQKTNKGCLKNWYPYDKSCLKIYGDSREEMLSWKEAAEKCRRYGGHLVSIHSKEMQEFLTINLLLHVRTNVWIGLHDNRNESIYEWNDNSTVNFTNWANGEPSGMRLEKEDCVEMVFTSNTNQTGTWNDNFCNVLKPFICQKDQGIVKTGSYHNLEKIKESHKNFDSFLDVVQDIYRITFDYFSEVVKKAIADPRRCSENGGYRFHKSCYEFVSKKMKWMEAEDFCRQQYKGHLVSITDFTVQLFLDYIFKDAESTMWIGLRRKTDNVLRWEAGWHLTFSNWEHHLDIDNFPNGFCAIRLKNGLWEVTSCVGTFPFVCEKSTDEPPLLVLTEKESTCPSEPNDWKDLGGDYCYYFDTGELVNWYEAQFLCMRRGGTLASIHSQAETDSIEQFVRFARSVVFIGLFRSLPNGEEKNRFQWADHSHFDFEFWDLKEPNNDKEECVEVITETMAWNDINCLAKRGYICSTRKVPPNETISQNLKQCEGGISSLTILGIVGCVLFVIILVAVVLYHIRPCEKNLDESYRKASTVLERPPTVHRETSRYRYGDMVDVEQIEEENTVR